MAGQCRSERKFRETFIDTCEEMKLRLDAKIKLVKLANPGEIKPIC